MGDVEFLRAPTCLVLADAGTGVIEKLVMGDDEVLAYARDQAITDGKRYSFTNDLSVITDPGSYSLDAAPSGGGSSNVN